VLERAALLALIAAFLGAQESATRPDTRPLAGEKSPYLRQHVDNPVRWYPWGEEAFERARRENKPVFLSIGYASCHWCHVMEHESFENAEIARILNESFVAIKVDREERPDVDRVYMAAATAMTGRGGWPLNLFLTPELHPFYAGTYFPLDDRPNQTGFRTVTSSIRDAWRTRRDTLVAAARRLATIVGLDQLGPAELEVRAQALESRAADESASRPDRGPVAMELAAIKEILARKRQSPPKSLLARACEQLLRAEDEEHGGFGDDPKFPAPANLLALLRLHARGNAPAALAAVRRQCDAMGRGGIRDHLAGGFHRYATDREWEIPHFEKMLYDQALIARVYLELSQATGSRAYEAVCRETLDFCLARMRAKEGGFIAALDASVDGEEGATYVWTRAGIEGTLGGDELAVFAQWSGFDAGEPGEKRTIAARTPVAAIAKARGASEADVARLLLAARKKLLAARDARRQPDPVSHVITGWNAWLVSTLARAGTVLNAPRYLDAALETMQFLDARLRRPDGLYARRFIDGETRFSGELSDQAAVLEAMLDLHEATLDPAWLERAADLAERIRKRFGRPDGSFYDSTEPDLIFRTHETSDGAVPSGLSQMHVGLVRLALMTGRGLDEAKRTIEAVLPEVSAAPSDHAYGAVAWDLAWGPTFRVVLEGPRPVLLLLRAPLLLDFRPHVVTTVASSADRRTEDGRASAVVWADGRASGPVHDAASLLKLLDEPPSSRPESR
jgi:uncharacterized protein YyaL (SSP411 family)